MAKITITTPTLNDIDTLVFWGNSSPELMGYADDHWYSKNDLKKWLADPRDDLFLVAKIEGKLAGMCLVHHMRDWAFLSTLYVNPPHRGRKIGTKLLDEAHRQLRKNGISTIELMVKEDNLAAQKLYKKSKFRTGYKFIWMYKK